MNKIDTTFQRDYYNANLKTFLMAVSSFICMAGVRLAISSLFWHL